MHAKHCSHKLQCEYEFVSFLLRKNIEQFTIQRSNVLEQANRRES